mgnify:CR=1 FL=1
MASELQPAQGHDASYRRASLALAIGVFAIGWSAIFVRGTNVAGMVSAFYRLAIASLVVAAYLVAASLREVLQS